MRRREFVVVGVVSVAIPAAVDAAVTQNYQQLVEHFARDAAGLITIEGEVGKSIALGPSVTSPVGLAIKWRLLTPTDLVALSENGTLRFLKAGEIDIKIRIDDGHPL